MAEIITQAQEQTIDVSKYKDFSYKGFDSVTSIDDIESFVLSGIEAIKNVIKLYLMSNKGDYGRNVTKGGPLIGAIGKAMTSYNEDQLRKLVDEAMSIYSNIVVYDIVIVRDTTDKMWVITINFYDNYNKYISNVQFDVV